MFILLLLFVDFFVADFIVVFADVFATVLGASVALYQIQRQLHIANKEFCHFIVYTQQSIHHEIIKRDFEFWRTKMEEPLSKFYYSALLPEILDSRIKRNLPLRNIKFEECAAFLTKERNERKVYH